MAKRFQVLGGGVAEAAGALTIEAEIDHRLATLAVEALVGVGEHLAGHQGALLDQNRAAFLVGQELGTRRNAARRGLLRRDAVVHHLEGELGGLTDYVLELFRVALTWRLDNDPIDALAADIGLLGAQFVDAAADDLDGLVHRLAGLGDQGLFGEHNADTLVIAGADGHVAPAGGGGQRRPDGPAQEVGGRGQLGWIRDPHGDRALHLTRDR